MKYICIGLYIGVLTQLTNARVAVQIECHSAVSHAEIAAPANPSCLSNRVPLCGLNQSVRIGLMPKGLIIGWVLNLAFYSCLSRYVYVHVHLCIYVCLYVCICL